MAEMLTAIKQSGPPTKNTPGAANWLAPNKPVRVTYDGLWWVADLYQ